MRKVVGVVPFNPKTSEFILVTSRKHPCEYILPKGGIEHGETDQECALREAFEEAGIHGEITLKLSATTVKSSEITWYAMQVDKIDQNWSESHERERIMVKPGVIFDYIKRDHMQEAIKCFLKTHKV